LAFLFLLGRWPADEVDHINLIRSDNRWSNLREATSAENQIKGISKARGKWRAQIEIDGRGIYLGTFSSPKKAHAAYCHAAAKYHGRFARAS
jgi:hypothetical protein